MYVIASQVPLFNAASARGQVVVHLLRRNQCYNTLQSTNRFDVQSTNRVDVQSTNRVDMQSTHRVDVQCNAVERTAPSMSLVLSEGPVDITAYASPCRMLVVGHSFRVESSVRMHIGGRMYHRSANQPFIPRSWGRYCAPRGSRSREACTADSCSCRGLRIISGRTKVRHKLTPAMCTSGKCARVSAYPTVQSYRTHESHCMPEQTAHSCRSTYHQKQSCRDQSDSPTQEMGKFVTEYDSV